MENPTILHGFDLISGNGVQMEFENENTHKSEDDEIRDDDDGPRYNGKPMGAKPLEKECH
jgi:hypothetical protein